MPSRRVVRGHPAKRNVEPQQQGVPIAPEVQPQGVVTNVEFREAIRMLSQAVTNQVGQRENQQEGVDTSRIRQFLRTNPPSFTGSSVTNDLKYFVEELQMVFEIIHVVDIERMVVDMRSRMSLFVIGLSRLSSREGRAAMLIGDMDIARMMIHVQQVKEEKLKDREEF
ncbi:uncharacterized protein LOC125873834 [Solanum stenotomum]|uniref:uncharacterized protein LOC125873834 n=1 Tax=Solanum stenotomum TaxID=172797 RepID=UPI0020CFFC09|nr:uncharacterized protein LOC125873834 [Solanum stenotomum]